MAEPPRFREPSHQPDQDGLSLPSWIYRDADFLEAEDLEQDGHNSRFAGEHRCRGTQTIAQRRFQSRVLDPADRGVWFELRAEIHQPEFALRFRVFAPGCVPSDCAEF